MIRRSSCGGLGFDHRGGLRLSAALVGIVGNATSARVSVGDLLSALQDRALCGLILVFAATNVLPTPPGTSTVLGIPLIFLTAQLALGREGPWLPRWIAERSLDRLHFTAVIKRLAPWFARAERLFRPRLTTLTGGVAKQLLGGVCLLLSGILILPIPLGNMLPALAICLIALAVLERDGAVVLLGLVVAAVSLAVVSGVFYGFLVSIRLVLARILAQ